MPIVFVNASDMEISGYESSNELDKNKQLFQKIESIREKASQAMGLGSCKGNVIPKFAVIAYPKRRADINVRYFTPMSTHPTLAVSAGFCISAASFIKGTLLNEISKKVFEKGEHLIKIETPTGIMEVGINFPSNNIKDVEGETTRTIRLLMDGEVYV